MNLKTSLGLLLALVIASSAHGAPTQWEQLAPGVEYSKVSLGAAPLGGTGEVHVVRINPDLAKLKLLTAREHGGPERTAQ